MSYTRSGRKLVYPGETLYDTDVLLGEFYKMMDVSWLAQTTLASGLSSPVLFSDLACTPVSGLTVNVAPGAMYQYAVADSTTFGGLGGGLPADTTDTVFKQYLSLASSGTNNFTLTNNLTAGQFVYYMIEAQAVTSDVNPQPRQYFNISNPASPITNTEPETRQDYINFRLVEGTPSASNPPPVPTPDAGYTGLWLILLQFGQVTVSSGDISNYPGTVFINESLTQKISQTTADARYAQKTGIQNNSYIYAVDSSATPNTLIASVSPNLTSYTAGQTFIVLANNTNTGASTININGLGAVGILRGKGDALVAGDIKQFFPVPLFYDGSHFLILNNIMGTTNLVTNGYQIFPGGLIIQWGLTPNVTVSATNTVVTSAVTFPIAFPNNYLQMTISDSGGGVFTWAAGSGSNTSATIYVYGGVTTGTPQARFIAIGN